MLENNVLHGDVLLRPDLEEIGLVATSTSMLAMSPGEGTLMEISPSASETKKLFCVVSAIGHHLEKERPPRNTISRRRIMGLDQVSLGRIIPPPREWSESPFLGPGMGEDAARPATQSVQTSNPDTISPSSAPSVVARARA